MLIVCLALAACKAAQFAHTLDSRARVMREARDKFTPDAGAKAAALSVGRHRELEGRARHAMCGWQGEIAQVGHVSHVYGHPARAAYAVEFFRRRATAAWSGGASAADYSVRDENEADGEVRFEVTAQRVGIMLLVSHRGVIRRVSFTRGDRLGIDNGELCAVCTPSELLAYGGTPARCHDDNLVIGLKCREGTSCCELITSKDENSGLGPRMKS
jgi:hypothetical protein